MQLIADRYEPLEVIASGGMATVWRARDHRLDRLVALKRPHPGLAEDDAARRMDNEARAAASLSHPNLITIFDYGRDEEGPYLVMELLDGPTLEDRIADIEPGEAIEVGARIADGLAAIHAAGIVHRDVKPANVILSSHGPQLTDFGIATDPALIGNITDPGFVVATPSYAAPEVLGGDAPTPASDVYSLATVVHSLIDGTEVGEDLQRVLSSARSTLPDERPSAEQFAHALRSTTPTVVRPVVAGGSTMVLAATPPSGREAAESSRDLQERRAHWAVGILALAAVALISWGLAMAEDDADADAAPGSVDSSVDSSSTTHRATTTTGLTTTTAPPAARDLQALLVALEGQLMEEPRSDLKPPEVADLMRKVDEAIALAGDDAKEAEKAEKKLEEVVNRVADSVDEESYEEALRLLESIAEIVGIELDPPDDREKD